MIILKKTMTNKLKRMIISGANTLDMQKIAMNEGMLTLEQSGIIKALKGLTSLEEVYRVARHVQVETQVVTPQSNNPNSPNNVS